MTDTAETPIMSGNVDNIPTVPIGPGGRNALIGRRIFGSPLQRRVSYAVVFEILGVAFSTLILAILGVHSGPALLIAVVSSSVALTWNLIFNWLFEMWERKIGITHRPWWIRLIHTLCFEGGLILFLVPVVAMVLGVNLWAALLYEATLLIFFLIYSPCYAWIFDRVFGLPEPPKNYQKPA